MMNWNFIEVLLAFSFYDQSDFSVMLLTLLTLTLAYGLGVFYVGHRFVHQRPDGYPQLKLKRIHKE